MLLPLLTFGCAEPQAPPPKATPAPSAAVAAPVSRDLTFTLEGHLLHRDPPAWNPPMRLHLPAAEWRDETGQWHFELLEGSGTATGLGPDGAPVLTTLRTRVERLPGQPLLRQVPGVSRTYTIRGEFYFWSDRFPLQEIEVMLVFTVPEADGRWTVTHAPVPPAGPDVLAALGPYIDGLLERGEGAALISEQMVPYWGHPSPDLPLYGPLLLVEGSAAPAKAGATERDADLLAGRLLYVRNDYAIAVSATGDVLDPGELDEQATILTEATLTAARLPLSPDTRGRVAKIGQDVSGRFPPSDVARSIDEAVEAIRRELWLDLAMPDASRLAEGPALYAAHCAGCHGAKGEGPPPSMKDLFPPPIAPGDAEVARTLSPQRVWSAATFGVPGTAMVPMAETLDDAQRWAIAFHVLGLSAKGDTAPPSGVAHTLEDLALLTQDELADGAAFWRAEGTAQAAAAPAFAARRALRAAARGEAGGAAALEAALTGSLGGLREDPEFSALRAAKDEKGRRVAAQALAARLRQVELAP